MRKIFSILFALALVLSFSLVMATPVAAAATRYVDPSGTDDVSHGTGSGSAAWLTIQYAVGQVGVGDTIMVAAGTYPEVSETTITQDVTIIGADKTTTIIKKAGGFSGSYFFRVTGGRLSLSKVTLDGEGNLYGGVRLASPGTATISDNIFQNIVSTSYTGFGVVAYASNMIVSNNIFTNIGRVGIWVGQGNNNLVTGNNYTGKGAIDCLDYGIEVGMGGVATITGNTITTCTGVATSDGSTSAGILVTDYYGVGTTATITGNTLTGNTYGIAIGYDGTDASVVTAHFNNISGNTYGADSTSSTVTTDAECNWWGAADGPLPTGSGNQVSGSVDYTPWLTEAYAPQKSVAAPGGTAYFDPNQGSIEGLTAVPPPATPPVTLPYGMFNFTVCCFSGLTVTLNITLPGPVPVGTKWYKYNGGAWDALPIGDDNGDSFIMVTLTDGNLIQDEDGTVNGQITDQGAPGYPGAVGWETYPVSKVRVLLPWIALFAAVIVGASLLVLRRRQAQS